MSGNNRFKQLIVQVKDSVKRLYDNGAIHVVMGSFLIKFISFFGSIFIVRALSKPDYGIVGYVENLYSYALILAGLGLSNSMIRYVVLSENPLEKKAVHDHIIKKSTIINVALVVLGICVNYLVKYPEEFASARIWMQIILIALPFEDLVTDELFLQRGLFENKRYAIFSLVVSFVFIGVRTTGAYLFGIKGALWPKLMIYGFFAVLLLAYNKAVLLKRGDKYALAAGKKKEIDKYAFQYMITNSFWALLMLNDTFMIGLLTKDSTLVADYKVAYVLPGNLPIFAIAMGLFVGPLFTKNEKNLEWVRKNFKIVLLISASIIGFIAMVLFIIAKPIILFLYGEEYLNIVGLMRLLLIAGILNGGIRYTISNLLGAMGKVKINMIITAFGALLLFVLDLVFIPVWGLNGVAYANIITHSVLSCCLFCFFIHCYYRK